MVVSAGDPKLLEDVESFLLEIPLTATTVQDSKTTPAPANHGTFPESGLSDSDITRHAKRLLRYTMTSETDSPARRAAARVIASQQTAERRIPVSTQPRSSSIPKIASKISSPPPPVYSPVPQSVLTEIMDSRPEPAPTPPPRTSVTISPPASAESSPPSVPSQFPLWIQRISITEVSTVRAGISSYSVYTCVATTPGFSPIVAKRRFRDFVALRQSLLSQQRHSLAVIPDLPEKRILGNFNHDFLERRKMALQGFMETVRSSDPFNAALIKFLVAG